MGFKVSGGITVVGKIPVVVGAGGGGGGMLTPTTLDPSKTGSNMTLSNGDLTMTGNNGLNGMALSVYGASSGKWYWEATIDSFIVSLFEQVAIGIADADVAANGGHNFNSDLIASSGTIGGEAWGWISSLFFDPDRSEMWLNDSSVTTPLTVFGAGDTMGIALDLDNGAIWVNLNGTWENGASQGEIEAGNTTNAVATGLSSTTWYAGVNDAQSTDQPVITVNFGDSAFVGTVPSGFEEGFGPVS